VTATKLDRNESPEPGGHGGDHLWFLLKDPYWAFIDWEFSPATTLKIKEQNPELWLRIHDVTDLLFDGHNSHWYFDVYVGPHASHWYLQLPFSNRVFCAELGHKKETGQFCPVLLSNPIFIPRAGPSDWVEERWASITV